MTQNQTRHFKHVLRSAIALAGVMSLWSSLFTIVGAQPPARSMTPRQSQAVTRLAELASSGSNHAALMLSELGYKPENPGFNAFPVVRQFESAYLAAEHASPGSGDLLIAVLSQRTAAQYESAHHDPTLKYYLAVNTDGHQRFDFASPPSAPKPKPPVTKAIATLADYAEGNAIGGPQTVLRDYFGLSPDQAYDLLRKNDTGKAAIIEGANWVPESERSRRFGALVAEIDRAYDGSALKEKSLDEFRPKNDVHKTEPPVVLAGRRPEDKPPFSVNTPSSGPPPGGGPSTGSGTPPNPPAHPGPGPGPGQRPGPSGSGPDVGSPSLGITPSSFADEQSGLQHYREFLPEHYSAPSESIPRSVGEGMSQGIGQGIVQGVFDAVIEGAAGFGGIVFGNEVSAAPGLGKPRSLTWIPEDSPEPLQRGRILLNFEQTYNGTTREVRRYYGPVLLEDAYAAYRIAFFPDGMPAWSSGQAVGLMGLYDRENYLSCDADGAPKRFVYWRILLNPALFNSELGQSAIFVDSLPIVRGVFGDMLKSGASEEVADTIDEWLHSTPGTWKFIDRPMMIGNSGSRITVTPAGNRLSSDSGRFIDVRSFDRHSMQTDHEDPFTLGFQELFPEIVSSSHEYSRINGFAPVLALFRWAKTQGASIDGPIPSPTKLATPEAILIGGDESISPTADGSPKQIRERIRSDIDSCLTNLTKDLSAPEQEVLRQQQSVMRRASVDLEPAASAQEQHEVLLSQMEYIENLARSKARHQAGGSPSLTALVFAEQHSDGFDDDRLSQMRETLIQRYYPTGHSAYKHLQDLADEQDEIADREVSRVREGLKPALDDQALVARLMNAAGGSKATQYASFQEAEDEANRNSEKFDDQIDELEEAISNQQDSCIKKLPLQLHRSFSALQTDDAQDKFVREHCAGVETMEQNLEQLRTNRSKSIDSAEMAYKEGVALFEETVPKFDLWRKTCRSYLFNFF